jgi:hypothetical protein
MGLIAVFPSLLQLQGDPKCGAAERVIRDAVAIYEGKSVPPRNQTAILLTDQYIKRQHNWRLNKWQSSRRFRPS